MQVLLRYTYLKFQSQIASLVEYQLVSLGM